MLLIKALAKTGRAGFLGETTDGLSYAGFQQYLERTPLAEALLVTLFTARARLAHDKPGLGPSSVPKVSKLLDKHAMAMLYFSLPETIRDEWGLVFSSWGHGASFAALRREIIGAGSTVSRVCICVNTRC